jgi:hypothetical protein
MADLALIVKDYKLSMQLQINLLYMISQRFNKNIDALLDCVSFHQYKRTVESKRQEGSIPLQVNCSFNLSMVLFRVLLFLFVCRTCRFGAGLGLTLIGNGS